MLFILQFYSHGLLTLFLKVKNSQDGAYENLTVVEHFLRFVILTHVLLFDYKLETTNCNMILFITTGKFDDDLLYITKIKITTFLLIRLTSPLCLHLDWMGFHEFLKPLTKKMSVVIFHC